MYNIYCLQGFNNYYNRVVRKYNTINDYITYQINRQKQYQSFENINFNPNDCVETSQILNWPHKWSPDYFIIEDNDTGEFSRWFVMEAVRQRGQQYSYTLRRDLLCDYFNTIKSAPCFIEKATLLSSDPFIYNSEGMTFNQIKTSETPLKDKTGCPWIVGYYTELNSDTTITTDRTVVIDEEFNTTYDGSGLKDIFDTGSINVSKEFQFFSGFNNTTIDNDYGTYYLAAGVVYDCRENSWDDMAEFTNAGNNSDYTAWNEYYSKLIYNNTQTTGASMGGQNYDFGWWDIDSYNPYRDIADTYKYYGFESINSTINSGNYFKNTVYSDFAQNILRYNNKIVKFKSITGGEEYYSFSVVKKTTTDPNASFVYNNQNFKVIDASGSVKNNLWDTLFTIQANTSGFVNDDPSENYNYYVRVIYDQYTLTATRISDANFGNQYTLNFKKLTNKLLDNPYYMFAIPYLEDVEEEQNDTGLTVIEGDLTTRLSRGISIPIINKIIQKLGGGGTTSYIKDVQLLPYCPVRELISGDNEITVNNTSEGKFYYEQIRKTGSTTSDPPVSYIFFAKKSSFTFDITLNLSYSNKKISSQTDMYRLVSPNYNGQFEFNIAKNDGINIINVDCTYKPFMPYIHLNPDFGGLYGTDFNDSRGLICGGDFSMTMGTTEWDQYQISNKNYQNIFDREIQNLEVNNSVARQRDIFRAVSGTISGGISGATGGWVGAIAGAASGAIKGGINYGLNEQLRNEAIDYRTDQFGYNLGNIQALPASITKTTAFTYNNKIFPILEYYTCKYQEKMALAKKIAYNGMTVMRIGTIGEFINNNWSYSLERETVTSKNYIKGQIIRIDDINCDDFHVANEIANEVFKGAFYETKN